MRAGQDLFERMIDEQRGRLGSQLGMRIEIFAHGLDQVRGPDARTHAQHLLMCIRRADDRAIGNPEQAIRSFSGMVQAVSRSSPVLIAAKARRGRSIVSLFCDRAGLPQPRRHHGKLNTSTNPHADRVSSAITIHRPCRGDLPCGAGTPRRPKAVAKLAKI